MFVDKVPACLSWAWALYFLLISLSINLLGSEDECAGMFWKVGTFKLQPVQTPNPLILSYANMGSLPPWVSGFHLESVRTHGNDLAQCLAQVKGAIKEGDGRSAFHTKLSVSLRHRVSLALLGRLLKDLLPFVTLHSLSQTNHLLCSLSGVYVLWGLRAPL